jgi:hypothetical protein
METPKQHFDSPDGDFDESWVGSRSGPFACQPVKGVLLSADGAAVAEAGSEEAAVVVRGTWRNEAVHSILEKQYGMPVLPIYNSTVSIIAVAGSQRHELLSNSSSCYSHLCYHVTCLCKFADCSRIHAQQQQAPAT